jgi:hypothetical protein
MRMWGAPSVVQSDKYNTTALRIGAGGTQKLFVHGRSLDLGFAFSRFSKIKIFQFVKITQKHAIILIQTMM